MTAMITEAGVYEIDAAQYHRDPVAGRSLSSSGARKLLPPSCPALYRQTVLEGEEHRRVYDLGHAAHLLVLGTGAPIEVIDADNYQTKLARAQRDRAYDAGTTPLLPAEHDQVQAMAAALRAHPIAGPLFDPARGLAERALIWRDDEFGVWRRAMLDWHTWLPDGRLLIVDYKTAASAEPGAVSRSIANYGYHQQDAWYLDGAIATGLAGGLEPAFVFVFQEKTPPYLITVHELTAQARTWGRLRNRRAIAVYRDCAATGHWPGYADNEINPVDLPPWATRQHEAAYNSGAYDTEQDVA